MKKMSFGERYTFMDPFGDLPGGGLPLAEIDYISWKVSLPFEALIYLNRFGQPQFFNGKTPDELKEKVSEYIEKRKGIPSLEMLSKSLEGRTFEEAEEHYQTLKDKIEGGNK